MKALDTLRHLMRQACAASEEIRDLEARLRRNQCKLDESQTNFLDALRPRPPIARQRLEYECQQIEKQLAEARGRLANLQALAIELHQPARGVAV